jgi:hypothetical protein
MTGVAPRLREQRDVYNLADELRELYLQQFDAVRRDVAEVEWEDYKERQERINQLQVELQAKVPRPS